jgi:flagellar biosynthetic protein FlhB
MSEEPDKDEQTQAPTQKRKEDAARDGDVLQSKDFGTALVMAGGAAWLTFLGEWFTAHCEEVVRHGLQFNRDSLLQFDSQSTILNLGGYIVLPLASLFAFGIVAALAGPSALGSLGFRTGSFAFKPSRINPVSGMSRMLSANGLIELGKALLKALLLGGIGYYFILEDAQKIYGRGAGSITAQSAAMGKVVVHLNLYLAAGFALIAGIDVPIQILRRHNKLKMTKQQIKEEMRQSEGSPESKQHIRQRQHAILNGSARKAIEEANVVLTNPTHFAIAIRYRSGTDYAPVVVARGRDDMALAIRLLANEKNVPTLEYPSLTRAIYFTSRSGQTISEDIYLAVATILAFVFNLDRALADGITQPTVTVPNSMAYDAFGKRAEH